MLYSSKIFTNNGMGAIQASALIQGVNLGGCILAIPLLNRFGRRTMMLSAIFCCTIFIFLVGFFT